MSSTGEAPLSSREQSHHIETINPVGYDRVIEYADNELARISAPMIELHEARLALYGDEMSASELYDSEGVKTVAEQLYPENAIHAGNSYNSKWTKADLRLREGNAEFHKEKEKLDDLPTDSPELRERKHAYRLAILKAAKALGGYTTDLAPGVSENLLDQYIGIRESELSPKNSLEVEAVVVPAAAALSNYIRAWDALRDIDSGAINTDTFIFATGERVVPDEQKETLAKKGFTSGETEYESAQIALQDLLGISLEDVQEKRMQANYGSATRDIVYKQFTHPVGGKLINFTVLEAAYDRDRRLEGNTLPDRANTDETFYATLPFLGKEADSIVIKSHDTWIPYQEVIGNKVFGLYGNKNVIASGAYKDNRVLLREDGSFDVAQAQGVIDEIAKKHDDLVKLRVLAENAKANYAVQ